MSAPRQLLLFTVALAALFAAGATAGTALGPDARSDGRSAHDSGEEHMTSPVSTGAHSEAAYAATTIPSDNTVRGLAVADRRLRLVVEDPELRRSGSERVRFRIVDADGDTVRRFDVEHTKRMHLIVVRRDLTGFQHLHPRMRADGTWTTPLTLEQAGSYRLYADFSHEGKATTLAGDLRVDGTADLRALPAASTTAVSDGGYDVRLERGAVRPGMEAQLRFTVTQNGQPVHVEPYLGAKGHLVALRDGDLAFLHVHPTEGGHGHATEKGRQAEHDDAVSFAATFPTQGAYRLFLQFSINGRVETVALTQEVR